MHLKSENQRRGDGQKDLHGFRKDKIMSARQGQTMTTPWIAERQLQVALQRNEAFWKGELEEYPLLWVTVPGAINGVPPPRIPATDEEQWTDVDYQIAKTEYELSHTYFASDALPIHNPWLGPDQFAAWLGGSLSFSTQDNTSWTKPFVDDWAEFSDFSIRPDNHWWRTYLAILSASVEHGKGRWVTTYPDLHTGIDGLGAMRGPERLMLDLVTEPDIIVRAMGQMTRLWKEVVDVVSERILIGGQGTTNWTGGWSAERFLCIGQNDFSCLISPGMFDEFLLSDTRLCCGHVDHSIYHLDGPGALQHLPRILELEHLNCVQWIQGAGAPLPSEWVSLLRRIQDAGKSVQIYYGGAHGGSADFKHELDALCGALDPRRLFIVATVDSVEKADFIVRYAREVSSRKRRKTCRTHKPGLDGDRCSLI